MNFLKRRFSSGDLQGELEDQQNEQDIKLITKKLENSTMSQNNNATNTNNPNFSNMFNFTKVNNHRKGPSPSAPTSPSKNISFTDSVLNVARVMINANNNNNNQHPANSNNNNYNNNNSIGSKFLLNRDKTKILFVIDDEHTEWSKYFKNRKLIGDFEIRVEQVNTKLFTIQWIINFCYLRLNLKI